MRTILNCFWACAFALLPLGLGAQMAPEQAARRVAALASLAIDEYRLGIDDGRVVQQAEYDEAVLFLTSALRDAAHLSAPAGATARQRLAALLAGVRALTPPPELDGLVRALRHDLEQTLGITLDPLPTHAPSLQLGAQVYRRECAQCHGLEGAGDGPAAAGLEPAPANLTDPALRAATPLEFFRKVTFGVAGTAMPGYEQALDVEQRWAVALYASGLRYAERRREAGRRMVAACGACRAVLADLERALTLDDDSLVALVRAAGGSAGPAVRAYARTAAAHEELGGDRGLRLARVLDAARALADSAVGRTAADPAAADRLALDAYLAFEGVEAEVRARRPDLAGAAEQAFAALRGAAGAGDTVAAAQARAAVGEALSAVGRGLAADDAPLLLFGQSLLIILREGLEAILIIGALTAVLLKAGAARRRREIGWGALAAVAASGLGAVLLLAVFHLSAATQEVLEGVTMLVAAVVLFTVASWLVSKIQAARWRAFVGAQMQRALASRGRFALAGLAFLVVFREGIETVLFYGALYATTDGPVESLGVTSGLVVGSVVLTLVYLAINRWGVRLPLRPIFACTGVLLLVMAFSFAGQGVAELQAGGLLPLTRLDILPALPVLGIFPTVQTLTAQLALLTAFGLAVVVLVRRPRVGATPPPA